MMTLLGLLQLRLTLVFATEAVKALWTWLVTFVTDITSGTMAFPCSLIARRVVQAITFVLTFRSIVSHWTLRLAGKTYNHIAH